MDSFEKRDEIKTKFSEHLKKIINYDTLIHRLNSQTQAEGLEDVLAEIDVALLYLKRGASVEYEPNLTLFGFDDPRPPDFLIKMNGATCYIEVKRILEPEKTRKERSIKHDIKTRLMRHKSQYIIFFGFKTLDYTKWDTKTNKQIVSQIVRSVRGLHKSEMNIPILIGDEEIGDFDAIKKSDTDNRPFLVANFSIQLHNRVQSIHEHIMEADKKSVPNGEPFLVICMVDGHVSDMELEWGSTGQPVIKTVIETSNGKVIDEYVKKEDIALGNPNHFTRIGGVLFKAGRTLETKFFYNPTSRVSEDTMRRLLPI